MNGMPAPLVPAGCCVRELPLPLTAHDIMHGRAFLMANDREFRALVNLMAYAWTRKPAASIGEFAGRESRLWRIADTTRHWWTRHGEQLLAEHFVLCSDGRLYHPLLAQRALALWRPASTTPARVRRDLDVGPSEWMLLRRAVFERDGYRCHYCGREVGEPHCDHVLPVVLGGQSVMENLVTACSPCNLSKGPKTLQEWVK